MITIRVGHMSKRQNEALQLGVIIRTARCIKSMQHHLPLYVEEMETINSIMNECERREREHYKASGPSPVQ